MNDLAARIRWGNIARIAAVALAIGLVVAWPKLKAKPPALPPAATVPQTQPVDPLASATTETTEAATVPLTNTTPVETVEPEPDPKPARHKPKRKRRKMLAPAPSVVTPAPAPAPVPPPKPKPEFEPFG